MSSSSAHGLGVGDGAEDLGLGRGWLPGETVGGLLADAMEAGGFQVERGVAGIPTSFIATIGTGQPVIGILGEYDALPGLSQQAIPVQRPAAGTTSGHGCGHHLFGVASAEASLAIGQQIRDGNLKGTLRFYGCPAEEGEMPRRSWFASTCLTAAMPCSTGTPRARTRPATSRARGESPPSSGSTARVPMLPGPRKGTVGSRRPRADQSRGRAVARAYTRLHADPPYHHRRRSCRTWSQTLPRLSITSATHGLTLCKSSIAPAEVCRSRCPRHRNQARNRIPGGILEIMPNDTLAKVARANLVEKRPRLRHGEVEFAESIRKTLSDPPELTNLCGVIERSGQGAAGSTDVGDVSWVAPMRVSRQPAGCLAHRPIRGRQSPPVERQSVVRE